MTTSPNPSAEKVESRKPYAGKSISVFDKPLPARVLLARALGITVDEAGLALSALIEGGYGIAPRLPTNGMLAAYCEATCPPKGHESVITAIAKARLRWQAMLAEGTAMSMSLKYIPDDLAAALRTQAQGGDR